MKNPESSAKIVGAFLTPELHATVGAFYRKKRKKQKEEKKGSAILHVCKFELPRTNMDEFK